MAIPCSSAAAITCGSRVDPPACTMARTPASAAVWLGRVGVETLFIEPGSPWENGYNESFNGTLRNELLKREICYAIPSYGLSGLITFGTIISPQSSESAWGDFSMPGAHRPKRDSIGRM